MEREFVPTIGLEVHAELSTNTKAYCKCKVEYGTKANTNICPVCMGLPGALPAFNSEVLNRAIKLGLVTDSTITRVTKFDRKNYFYPDLTKGYQITQANLPIAENGKLTIKVDGEEKTINIERIHMEEDTAKLNHDPFGRGTLIDFNRCGVPLIEIVSKPDMHSTKEAIEYLQTLRKLLVYLDIADCKMEEGGFRADVNVSVSNSDELGQRVEIKNMNSFKAIERAINYEIQRQKEEILKGNKITQSTLRWDDVEGVTRLMRTKETAKDYRYFPEQDLPVVEVSQERIDDIEKTIPELLDEKEKRYIKEYKLSDKQLLFVLSNNTIIKLFEDTIKEQNSPQMIANYLMTEIAAYLNNEVLKPEDLKLTSKNFARFIKLIEDGSLNSKTAKQVIAKMLSEGKDPDTIIKEDNLVQITDQDAIKKAVLEVLAENQQSIEDYKNGKDKALAYLVGQVMKKTQGKANPGIVNTLIKENI